LYKVVAPKGSVSVSDYATYRLLEHDCWPVTLNFVLLFQALVENGCYAYGKAEQVGFWRGGL
jgi:hypothetical protein